MRRINSIVSRLGTSLCWSIRPKVHSNYVLIYRFLDELDAGYTARYNNLRRTRLRSFIYEGRIPHLSRRRARHKLLLWKKSDRRFPSVVFRLRHGRRLVTRSRNTGRVVFLNLEFRRRGLYIPAILFYRKRIAPFWGTTKWLRRRFVKRMFRSRRIRFNVNSSLRHRGWDVLSELQRSVLIFRFFLPRFVSYRFGASFLSLCRLGVRWSPRNIQNLFYRERLEIRSLYESYAHARLSRSGYSRSKSFSFMMVVISSSFRWRNALLLVSTMGFEMRRTDFHFRFIRIFGRFLAFLILTKYTFLNIYIRVRGCFGRVDRTRVFYIRPSFKRNLSMCYQGVIIPVKFAFCHVTTFRGVFGMGLWLS